LAAPLLGLLGPSATSAARASDRSAGGSADAADVPGAAVAMEIADSWMARYLGKGPKSSIGA